MPEHFYAAAQAGFSGAGSGCRNKSNNPAGVPLRTGKTGRRSPGNYCCTIETICGGVAGIETTCDAAAFECKSNNAPEAAGGCRHA
jgi:hypothetical protein